MTITGPTIFYHRTEKPRTVANDAEYALLGPGWEDTPAAFFEEEPEPPAVGTFIQCGKADPKDDSRACMKPMGHRGAHLFRGDA